MLLPSASGASPLNAPMLLQKVQSSSIAPSFGAQLNSEWLGADPGRYQAHMCEIIYRKMTV